MSKRSDERSAKDELALRCRRFLKGEIAASEVSYAELARRLSRMGFDETERSITMKISRGVFPAWFLVAVMNAIGRQHKRISDISNGG